MRPESYSTPSGIEVSRTISKAPYQRGLRGMLHKLDRQLGVYLSAGYEYPERYSRWEFASIAPPMELIAAGREVHFHPLNARGEILARMFEPLLESHAHWESFSRAEDGLRGSLKPLPELFAEEERSKQPSAFSILRALVEEFRHPLASRLAFIGAFGYDLLFQFDPIEKKLEREGVKDLHLFLCDDIYFLDRKKEQIERVQYDFARGDETTRGLKRAAARIKSPRKKSLPVSITSDHTPAEYVAK